MIAVNIPLFYAINEMPIVLDPARLDDGGGIEESLRTNEAQYHQSCRLMLNSTKLERARKRITESTKPTEFQTKLPVLNVICVLHLMKNLHPLN